MRLLAAKVPFKFVSPLEMMTGYLGTTLCERVCNEMTVDYFEKLCAPLG
jgi:hypothetical protein